MRAGVALSLWSKEEWGDQPAKPAKPVKKVAAKKAPQSPEKPLEAPQSDATASRIPADPEIVGRFVAACKGGSLDPDEVAKKAGVNLDAVTVDDMDKLRAAFKEMITK